MTISGILITRTFLQGRTGCAFCLKGMYASRLFNFSTLTVFSGPTRELGLSHTGISELENEVPLPLFLSSPGTMTRQSPEDLVIRYHFLAQVSLRIILNRIGENMRTTSKFIPTNSTIAMD